MGTQRACFSSNSHCLPLLSSTQHSAVLRPSTTVRLPFALPISSLNDLSTSLKTAMSFRMNTLDPESTRTSSVSTSYRCSKLSIKENPLPCLSPVDAAFPVLCNLPLLQSFAMCPFFLHLLQVRVYLALQLPSHCPSALHLTSASLFVPFAWKAVEATSEPALDRVLAKLIKSCFMSLNRFCTPKFRKARCSRRLQARPPTSWH